MSIAENIAIVRARIQAAARRAGREPAAITLMAVSKTFPPEAIREAYAAGIRVFGENRVQEFAGKADALRDLAEAEWHLIGHLQSNKAARAAELFGAIDSVDSVRLAERLDAAGDAVSGETAAGDAVSRVATEKRIPLAKRVPLPVLIEINVGGEAAKSGLAPDAIELELILSLAPGWKNLTIRGLMTVPPYTEDPEGARPYFRRLREIRDGIAARRLASVAMDVLSMGMSHDFEVAIEEGSTCVRVGTAIFGERPKAIAEVRS